MEVIPLTSAYLEQAVSLYTRKAATLHREFPFIPEDSGNPQQAAMRISQRIEAGQALGAVEQGRLVGYLGWFVIDDFRVENRRAGYSPEWAHALEVEQGVEAAHIQEALYREGSKCWARAGCNTHALTFLASEYYQDWFWRGFGGAVIDAVRPMDPIGARRPDGVELRIATPDDVDTLALLEGEHLQHYRQPPIFMDAGKPSSPQAMAAYMCQGRNSFWLAQEAGTQRPLGYLRFEENSTGASWFVRSKETIANNGAYVRKEARGLGIAAALLGAALDWYREQGFHCCSVDFESFNPQAHRFWLKHFQPVCYSLIRVPEIGWNGE